MAKIIIAFVFCVFLLMKGEVVEALGADCTDTCTDAAETCKDGKCQQMLGAGGDCSKDYTYCDTMTTCQSGTCKIKNGMTCTKGTTANCLANADCTTVTSGGVSADVCVCKTDYPTNKDGTKCGGAMGIAASVLLLLTTFLTSRFV